MPEFITHNLWPIPVYEANIPVREKWKVLLKGLKYERTHIANSDISIDRYILNSMPELKKEIKNHCENFIRKYLHVKDTARFYFFLFFTHYFISNLYSSLPKVPLT